MTENTMRPSRAVRVLHVHGDLIAGGGQVLSREWLRYSDPSRIVPYVVVLNEPLTLAPSFEENGVSVTLLEGSRIKQIISLARFIRVNKIDVVHSQSEPDRKVAHWAALITRRPVIAHIHSEWLWWSKPKSPMSTTRKARSLITRTLRRISDRSVRHYIPTSDAVYRAYAPFVSRSMTTVEPGAAIPEDVSSIREMSRHEYGVGDDEIFIACVSRFDTDKNIEDFVYAIDKVCTEIDVQAILIGEGPDRVKIEDFIKERNLTDVIRVADPVSEISSLYCAADIYLTPSLYESFGMSVLEAMSWGNPVIGYDLFSYRRYVPESYIAVPIGDVDRLAQETIRLASNKELRLQMGALARAQSKRYDIRKGAAAITELDEIYGHGK